MQAKLTLLIALLFGGATFLPAQWGIVRETERIMSFGNRPCFRIEFANTDDKLVLETWKEFAKKNFEAKVKKDRKSDEYIASEAKATYIAAEQFTIYVQLEKNGTNTAFNAWFDVGPYFLNSRENPESARETADVLRQFYYEVRRNAIGSDLKEAEDQLKSQESALKKLERDNEGLHKSIEEYKARIKKAEEDIQKNTKEQETTLVNMDVQKKKIEEIKVRIKNVENERQ